MQAESIESSAFFAQLVGRHEDLWSRASAERWLVCVPQTVSLERQVVSRAMIGACWFATASSRDVVLMMELNTAEDHLLQESDEPGEYTTLSHKRVVITGLAVTAEEGFARPVTARILDQRPARAAGSECTVLLLNRPLEGGIDAPSGVADMDDKTVRRILAMVETFSDAEPILSAVDAFCSQVAALVDVGRRTLDDMDPPLERAVLRQCEFATDLILRSSMLHYMTHGLSAAEAKAARQQIRLQLIQCLECRILVPLRRLAIPWLAATKVEETRRLVSGIRAVRRAAGLGSLAWPVLQRESLGLTPRRPPAGSPLSDAALAVFEAAPHGHALRADFRTDYSEALSELLRVRQAIAPLHCKQCLRDSMRAATRALTDHLGRLGRKTHSQELASEDVIAIACHLLVLGAEIPASEDPDRQPGVMAAAAASASASSATAAAAAGDKLGDPSCQHSVTMTSSLEARSERPPTVDGDDDDAQSAVTAESSSQVADEDAEGDAGASQSVVGSLDESLRAVPALSLPMTTTTTRRRHTVAGSRAVRALQRRRGDEIGGASHHGFAAVSRSSAVHSTLAAAPAVTVAPKPRWWQERWHPTGAPIVDPPALPSTAAASASASGSDTALVGAASRSEIIAARASAASAPSRSPLTRSLSPPEGNNIRALSLGAASPLANDPGVLQGLRGDESGRTDDASNGRANGRGPSTTALTSPSAASPTLAAHVPSPVVGAAVRTESLLELLEGGGTESLLPFLTFAMDMHQVSDVSSAGMELDYFAATFMQAASALQRAGDEAEGRVRRSRGDSASSGQAAAR